MLGMHGRPDCNGVLHLILELHIESEKDPERVGPVGKVAQSTFRNGRSTGPVPQLLHFDRHFWLGEPVERHFLDEMLASH